MQQVARGLVRNGFCILDVDATLKVAIEKSFERSRHFFDLPLAEKEKVASRKIHEGFGYISLESEKIAGYEPDYKEFFEIGLECDRDSWRSTRPEFVGFYESFYTLYRQLNLLSLSVLRSLCADCNPPCGDLDRLCQNSSITTARMNHYPISDRTLCAQHEDNTVLTAIVQSDPALQILDRQGQWIEIDTHPGQIVFLLGNMLSLLVPHENFKPTTHRALKVPNMSRDRYSIAHFTRPIANYPIQTAAGSCTAEEVWKGGYDAMTASQV